MVGLLLAIFLGPFGGYRFYKKQYALGIVYILTCGMLLLGWIFDIICASVEFYREYKVKSFTSTIESNYKSNDKSNYNLPAADPVPLIVEAPDTPRSIFEIHSSKATKNNINQLKDRFIVFDVETTGLDPLTDRIVSLGAVLYEKGVETSFFYTYVHQDMHIPFEATCVHGITDAMIADAPSEESVCKSFVEFCGDAIQGKTLLVAYNSSFDAKFIKKAMDRNDFEGNIRHFDVWGYARRNLLNLKNYKQVTVAEALKISTDNAHNALADCRMCAAILLKLFLLNGG